jgi:hypothetical protein
MRRILTALAIYCGTLLPYSNPVQAQVGPGYIPAPYAYTYYICLNDPRSFVHIRSAPSRSASSMGRLGFGTIVPFHRRFVANDGMYWAEINYFGMRAYIRDDYVCIY